MNLEAVIRNDIKSMYWESDSTIKILDYPKSSENDNVVILVNKKKFVVRFYSSFKKNVFHTKELINEEVDIVDFFGKHGVLVAKPIRDKRGELVKRVKNRFASVFEFIEGTKTSEINMNKFASIGKLLGILHKVSIGNNLKSKRKGKDFTFNPFEGSYVGTAYPEIDISEFEKEGKQLNNQWNRQIERTPLKKYLVHGDIHSQNIVWDRDNVKAVLDFDDMKNSYPMFELLRFIFVGLAFKYRVHYTFDATKENIDSLIENYQSIRPLSKNEKALIGIAAKKFFIYGIEMVLQATPKNRNDYLQEAEKGKEYLLNALDISRHKT